MISNMLQYRLLRSTILRGESSKYLARINEMVKNPASTYTMRIHYNQSPVRNAEHFITVPLPLSLKSYFEIIQRVLLRCDWTTSLL